MQLCYDMILLFGYEELTINLEFLITEYISNWTDQFITNLNCGHCEGWPCKNQY